MGEQDPEMDIDGDEDTPQISPKETVARFYFGATMELAQDDITKVKEIEGLSARLCLSVLSRNKDRREEEKRQMEKLKSKTPQIR